MIFLPHLLQSFFHISSFTAMEIFFCSNKFLVYFLSKYILIVSFHTHNDHIVIAIFIDINRSA